MGTHLFKIWGRIYLNRDSLDAKVGKRVNKCAPSAILLEYYFYCVVLLIYNGN